MKLSHLFTKTLREAPRDEESKSAQLLIRAGFIFKEMAGVYTFLPLGLAVLRNIEQIVRDEMNAIGASELQMTGLQTKEIWETTGRWDDKAIDVWFKTKLHSGTELGLAATHEEPITRIMAQYANSYKDLPVLAYQFQWKMRNELRAKSGILRGREFRMKDLYSFAATQEQHDEIYERVRQSYERIYDRLGIGADTYYTYASGGMFSKFSHEFQTVLPVGEDTIRLDAASHEAINEELLEDKGALKESGLEGKELKTESASEVGNIFSLGTKYSEPLGATFSDDLGKQHPMIMGCYGIGVSRLMGVLAEYFSDDKGLVWPEAVAPAKVHLVQIGTSENIVKTAEKTYNELQAAGISVLYDDRDISVGTKFKDADLIGCPIRVTLSEKTLEKTQAEVQKRTESEATFVPLGELIKTLS